MVRTARMEWKKGCYFGTEECGELIVGGEKRNENRGIEGEKEDEAFM